MTQDPQSLSCGPGVAPPRQGSGFMASARPASPQAQGTQPTPRPPRKQAAVRTRPWEGGHVAWTPGASSLLCRVCARATRRQGHPRTTTSVSTPGSCSTGATGLPQSTAQAPPSRHHQCDAPDAATRRGRTCPQPSEHNTRRQTEAWPCFNRVKRRQLPLQHREQACPGSDVHAVGLAA